MAPDAVAEVNQGALLEHRDSPEAGLKAGTYRRMGMETPVEARLKVLVRKDL